MYALILQEKVRFNVTKKSYDTNLDDTKDVNTIIVIF